MPVPGLAQFKGALPRMSVLTGIWAGLVGLLVAAGEIIVGSAAMTGFDHHVTREVVNSRSAALNSVMRVVAWLGSWVALVAVAAVIALLVARKRLPVLAVVVAVFAWAGEALGVRIAKEAVTRDRPPRDIWVVPAHGWSFLSGHAATASLVFTALALCVAVLARHRLVRALGLVIAVLAVAATAFSRVELGVHWTTDVIASIVFVACWLAAIWIAFGGRLRQPGRDSSEGDAGDNRRLPVQDAGPTTSVSRSDTAAARPARSGPWVTWPRVPTAPGITTCGPVNCTGRPGMRQLRKRPGGRCGISAGRSGS